MSTLLCLHLFDLLLSSTLLSGALNDCLGGLLLLYRLVFELCSLTHNEPMFDRCQKQLHTLQFQLFEVLFAHVFPGSASARGRETMPRVRHCHFSRFEAHAHHSKWARGD